MKDQARVVIIGGGIAGCSIAYHLTMAGWTDIMLVDKGELTSGSTWHAAGLLTQFHTSPNLMRLRIYSTNLYRQMNKETHGASGWHEVGSIRVASSPDHFQFLQRQIGQAKALGMEVEMITPTEALRIYPHMTDKDLYGALYIPGDGHLDPSSATMEIARRAREMGASIHTGVRVTGITLSPKNEVQAVVTDHGAIKTEIVVNAAGIWGKQVGEMVGVNLPMTPLIHQHATTRPIPGHELPQHTPVLRDPANLCYVREEVGGFLIGGFEVEPKAVFEGGAPWDFTQQLFPGDWELFSPIMEGAIRRIPILEHAEVHSLVNGPEAITPDSRPLLGPVPGLHGYYAACGLSHTGFGAGAAIGEIITEWIIEGEPARDTSEFNVRRFGEMWKDQNFTTQRARESYKYYYFLRYPHDENETARPRRVSPLDEKVKERGAAFGEKNGWERVNYFEPGRPWRRMGAEQHAWGWGHPPFFDRIGEEHRAVRERVALFDMTSFGKIDVRGPGALALLQKLADNDIDRPVGSLIYTQFLNERGGIESDLTIARLGEDYFRVITGSNFVASDMGWIKLHLPPAGDNSVEIGEVTEDWAVIGMWGPRARDVLRKVTSDDVSGVAFPYMTARQITVGNVPVLALRVTYVGELGWELYVAPKDAPGVWEALREAGKEFGIQPDGYKALDSLRLEKGYRYWSGDITPSENPYEAGLGFCVRLKKGDFIGREALLKHREQGATRKLSTITLTPDPSPAAGRGEPILYGGEPVYSNGKVVGRLRSGGYGYTVGKNIGLVYLPLELTKEGTPLEVESFGERFPAQVAADVLYDPEGKRIKA